VHPEVGYKVAPGNEEEVILQIEKILGHLESDRDLLFRLRQQGLVHARECLTWDAKAYSTSQVLNWVVGRGPKPDLPWTKMARVKYVDDPENGSLHEARESCSAAARHG
jgi:hypothetical protein